MIRREPNPVSKTKITGSIKSTTGKKGVLKTAHLEERGSYI